MGLGLLWFRVLGSKVSGFRDRLPTYRLSEVLEGFHKGSVRILFLKGGAWKICRDVHTSYRTSQGIVGCYHVSECFIQVVVAVNGFVGFCRAP